MDSPTLADMRRFSAPVEAAEGSFALLGFAYYYAGETYYVLNEGEQLLKTITRAITYLDQAEQWDMVARAYNITAIPRVLVLDKNNRVIADGLTGEMLDEFLAKRLN